MVEKIEPIKVSPEIEDEFVDLARAWHDETCFMSNGQDTTQNDYYHQILSRARIKPYLYIPLILKYYTFTGSREATVGHSWGWPYMLDVLLGEFPRVPAHSAGVTVAVCKAYHELALRKGYVAAL